MDYYENFDLDTVITPVNVVEFQKLLKDMEYNKQKSKYLIDSLRNGFDLGYRGKTELQRRAPNWKLRVGNETILWNKVMKEVKLKRFAGPFKQVPYRNFIQSSDWFQRMEVMIVDSSSTYLTPGVGTLSIPARQKNCVQ